MCVGRESECLRLQLVGLPSKDAVMVKSIKKGRAAIFLYNFKSHRLLGVIALRLLLPQSHS